jgi:TRAP-type C4-dicarboxylate transport system permease small subunit
MQKLRTFNLYLNRSFLVIAGVAVLGLMLIAGSNVLLRLAGRSFSGAYELAGYLGALVIAFALGETQRRRDHIVVDVFTRKFPPALNRWLDRLQLLITLAFFVIVSRQVWFRGLRLWRTGEVAETLKFVYYPFVFAVSVGFFLFAVSLLLDLILTFDRKKE